MSNGKRKKKLKIIIPIILVAALLAGATTFMFWPGNITAEQAVEIALEHVGGGNANRAERDFKNFQRAWSVEVYYGNFVHEVYINRFTGEVIRVEIDRWD